MNKPNKCKNCQWYGKPYWSIINPCDSCPNENNYKTIITIDREPLFKEVLTEEEIKKAMTDKSIFQITLEEKDKEIDRLNNIISDKKERQDIAIRLLQKMFGTDDYEINYIIGIINGQRQIKFDEELKEGK